LREEGYPLKTICSALGVNRSTYYKRRKGAVKTREPRVDQELASRVESIIREDETFGYRRVWAHLRFKEGMRVKVKKVHRIVKLKGWGCKLWRRPSGLPRPTAVQSSTAQRPDVLWCADATRVFCGRDGWATLIAVIDGASREIVGYRFSPGAGPQDG